VVAFRDPNWAHVVKLTSTNQRRPPLHTVQNRTPVVCPFSQFDLYLIFQLSEFTTRLRMFSTQHKQALSAKRFATATVRFLSVAPPGLKDRSAFAKWFWLRSPAAKAVRV
jgi:hypothetical protein